jgi:hypothetical protein
MVVCCRVHQRGLGDGHRVRLATCAARRAILRDFRSARRTHPSRSSRVLARPEHCCRTAPDRPDELGDVLSFARVMTRGHYSTEKPVGLLKALLWPSSQLGRVVLDPCASSNAGRCYATSAPHARLRRYVSCSYSWRARQRHENAAAPADACDAAALRERG